MLSAKDREAVAARKAARKAKADSDLVAKAEARASRLANDAEGHARLSEGYYRQGSYADTERGMLYSQFAEADARYLLDRIDEAVKAGADDDLVARMWDHFTKAQEATKA